jgi:hypothetical protein
MLSATTIIGVGLLTHSHWIWIAALLGFWRLLMDYVISPRVMGHELEIHPLLAIFTLMVGGAVGGIVGVSEFIYLYQSLPAYALSGADLCNQVRRPNTLMNFGSIRRSRRLRQEMLCEPRPLKVNECHARYRHPNSGLASDSTGEIAAKLPRPKCDKRSWRA